MVATSTSIPTCRTDGLGVKGGCLSESILVVETKCPPGALSISLSLLLAQPGRQDEDDSVQLMMTLVSSS